jgi:PAS domain S-box-containing protein
MNENSLPYFLPYFVSLGITLAVAAYAWRQRRTIGARSFAVAALSEALWTAGYIAELASPDLAGKIFWDDVQFFAGGGWALAFYVFGMEYAGQRLRYARLIWTAHTLVISSYLLLVLTDRYHHLIRPEAQLIPGEPFSALVYPFTLPTWLVYLYFMGTFIFSLGLMAGHLGHAQRLYRAQTLIILVGMAIPLVGVTLTILGVTLSAQRDTTPLTFALSNLILAWGPFRYRLFALVPIARTAIIEALHDAVLILDDQGRVVDGNPAAQALAGRPLNAILGKPAGQVFEHWPQLLARLADSAQSEAEISLTAGAQQRTFHLTLSALHDQGGQRRGLAVIAHDVTRLKQSEEILRRSNAQLEAANRELEAFSYSVSHDLRAPLRTIDGFSQLVMEEYAGPLPAEARRYLERVRAGTRQMRQLIDSLLEFSRLGRQALRLEAVPSQELRTLVVGIVDELRLAEAGREIEVRVAALPGYQADRALLRQVWTNLIANALKYTRHRPVARVEIGAVETAHGPAYFVRDNGAGFDPQQSAHLFGVFQRLHRQDEFEGTGIGLANVRRIVERHGGRIWAEAEPDNGAAFFFTLPTATTAASIS